MRAAIRLALPLLALAGAAPAQDWWQSFQTPSGNIHCLGADDPEMGTFVDCEIREMTTPVLQPRPDWCDLDWGHRFSVSEGGEASMGCAGDTVVYSKADILPYGATIAFGSITCESATSGLTCRNGDGHGFFLARGEQGLF